MTAGKHNGRTIRVERMGPAQLRVIREQLEFVREMTDAGEQYAARVKIAGERLRGVIRSAVVGDLKASADREAFKRALEKGRMLDVSFLDVIPPSVCDQGAFEETVAEISKRLEAAEKPPETKPKRGTKKLCNQSSSTSAPPSAT